MVVPLAHHKADHHLGEEGVALPPVGARVEPQLPPGALAAAQLGEHGVEGVDGDLARGVGARVGQPRGHAAVVVGARLEGGGRGRGVCGEADEESAGGRAGLGVEDVAGYAVFGGHCVFLVVCLSSQKLGTVCAFE